ncbi:hypothetical protein BDR26DRAFT_797953 [Obelidium mucronatum]|nr:hypothetical protein BDR26DRAFT_797953 [Obelidium mucronatum]
MSKFPHAQEVSETFATRFLAMKFIFLASILNIGLILLAWKMQAPLELPLPPSAVHVTCGVIVELIALITNELTINSLDLGVAIFVSMLMTNKSGYGTSACGLLQMKPINRLTFAQSLSLNSPCRKALERISYVWILLEVTKLLSPIAATGVISGKVRSLADSVSCIVFDANFAKMTDRTYPTMESSGGVAEFLFGNALGCMRSERGDCPADGSQFVFGPQLQGAVGTGDTIVGNGYAMTVATKCKCTETNSKEVINAGVMTTTDQEALSRATKNPFIFLTSTIIATNTSILSYAILGHTQICGGYSKSVMPVCLTNISNFQDAVVSASFETDGTTASIALTNSEIHHILPTKKIGSAAVLKALRTIWPLGKPQSLVSNVPALVNALIYWTSPDLKAIDPTLFPSGIETLYSIILRGGFQRTFNSKGTSCTREISRKDVTSVYFNFQGTIAVYIIGWIQLAASLFALVIGSVWFFSPVPLGPAIKVVTHPMYFISLLCESPFWINLQGTANAQNHVMWQNLDHITRIGESLDTLGEPIGRIKLERPRMVKNLVNGRIYA